MKKKESFFRRYWHAIPALLYMLVYLIWFGYLEKTVTKHYQVIHTDFDDAIPFCELFIVPYLLWFLYVAATVIYLFFQDKTEYAKCCIFLFSGMTVFLLISTLEPNGHNLRPVIMPRDNIFTEMVAALYRADTPTNIWPSIHVYNSIGAHLAVSKCASLKKYRFVRTGSLILCISIILSTMFLKQHSVFDVATAFLMAAGMYHLVYRQELVPVTRKKRILRLKRFPKIT